MYKQRCVGTKGPLMPMIFICACGLILYSATDAGVRGLNWSTGAFVFSTLLFVLATMLIRRYTRVEMEYVWFGGEFIVRRYESGRITRFVVRKQQIIGMRDRQGTIGVCTAGRTQNCCATLAGRMCCSSLYYLDDDGRAHKMLFQPRAELRAFLWAAATAEISAREN